jgi:DNA-binding transcriptional MerR regulator
MIVGDTVFKIGDFSRLAKISVRMLRYYDELGLLKPAEVDRFTGYRFYTTSQIFQLNKIIRLKDMGFNISEIAAVLNELDDAMLVGRLQSKKRQIEEAISCDTKKIQNIDQLIESVGKEIVKMNYDVTIKNVPACKVVSLRDTIPAYNREGELWGRLGEFMGRNKINCTGLNFAMYHDGEYKESNVDVEVASCIGELKKDKEGFTFREIEAVPNMASLMVPGSFENIDPAFKGLAEWLENNGYEMTGITRQVCHKGPWNEEKEENFLTEIQIPVNKK